MNTNPTPLDLDAIEADLHERSPARDPSDRNHVRALIEEAKRLREKIAVDRAMFEAFRPEVVAEVAVLVCDEMDWQAVATWCGATISSSSDMSGEYHSTIDIPGVGSAREGQWIIQRHDGTFAIRATLEGPSAESVARLTAHPAPAWDEEAVLRDIHVALVREGVVEDGIDAADAAKATLAVVREHLPVKPSREALIEAMLGSDIITDDLRAEASAQGSTQREPFLCFADAVLDLWPGRSEAEVKAEALREFAARVRDEMDASDKALGAKWATGEYRHAMRSALMQVDEEADRLAAREVPTVGENRSHPRCWTGTRYEHTCHQPSGRTCVEGCGRPAGTPWGPHWCPECDVVRLDRISASLEALAEGGDGRG